jgi:hypothetical protein
MRRVRFSAPMDTSLFTPSQLQPRFLFWLGMSGWARWVKDYLVPFRLLIRDHGLGVVVVGVHLEYQRPFGFFDADELEVEAGWRAKMGGIFLEGDYDFMGAGRRVAQGRCLLRPVRLKGLETFAAVPSRMPRSLLKRLEPDEVDRQCPLGLAAELAQEIEKAEPLLEASLPLLIHRHSCEVADQWSFIDLPAHATAARESLLLEHGGEKAVLRESMKVPLRSVDIELSRPFYVLDQANTMTKVYHQDRRLDFVHRIQGSDGEHALVVERFQLPDTY